MMSEFGKLRWTDNYPLAQAVGSVELPSGRVLKDGEEFNPYFEWRSKNKYCGRQFSILGDSISTLAGYNPRGYKVFYDGVNCEKSAVREMKDTWWGKVIGFFGGELLVNNSWSGSRVTRLPNNDGLFPSGCSDERTSKLHINSVNPDVIIVYLGTNDWAFGADKYYTDNVLGDDFHCVSFDFAYSQMLSKIKANYPDAEIWCCTLNTTFMSSNPSFKFPYAYGGEHIEEYNQIIKATAGMYKCKVIDLYDYHIPYDTVDGSHPNADGMNTLATLMIRSVNRKKIEQFMDYKDNQHEYFAVKNYSEASKYICKKCGKIAVLDNKYELLNLIGGGGMVKVYLAADKELDKVWAVKIIKTDTCKDSDVIREAVLKPAETLKLFNHPAIPKVADIIVDSHYIAIVQEYIEGATLKDIVEDYGVQPIERIVDWAKQVCVVLSYLHSFNPPYIYCDIKPDNLMLEPNGTIKLVEFGNMRTYNIMKDRDTCFLGTEGYAAPEQYGGRGQPNTRTDIYGLGMTIYNLLTGFDPSKQDFIMKPLRQVNPSIPKGMEYIIDKCTQFDSANRYQSCNELMTDLSNYQRLPPKKNLFSKLFKKI